MPLSFENDIKKMLEAAGGGCMLNNPVDPETGTQYPQKAFNIFDHSTVMEKSKIILVEFVLEKMPPKKAAPPGFNYQDAAKKFAQWIDEGMLP